MWNILIALYVFFKLMLSSSNKNPYEELMARLRQYRVRAVVEGGDTIEFFAGGPDPDSILASLSNDLNNMIIKIISIKEVKS